MAFAEKYYFEQKTTVKGANVTTTTRIELHQDGHTGGSTKLNGRGSFWTHEYENLDPVDIFKEPVQKSRLEMHINIANATDKAILEAIFAGDDDDYRLVKKVDGTIVWTGSVISDLLEYPEGGYPFEGTIIAKDLSSIEGDYYTSDGTIGGTLKSGEETIITTIAELLSYTGYGLDIHTYTSWKEQNMTDSTDDFLNEVLNNVQALRTYARTGDESDEPITVFEALKKICRNYGLILRQANGAWRLYHRSALSDPANVDEYIYDSTGTQTSKNTGASQVDISVSADRVVRYVLPKSRNKFNKGLKSTRLKYDHRTKVSGIAFPSDIELVDSTTESFTQLFIGDGTQNISLSFDVYADTDIDETSMDARLRVTIDTYYLQDDFSWDTTVNSYIELSLTKGKPLVGGGNVWRGSFNILTDDIPNAADGTLTIQFAGASGSTDFADETLYTNIGFEINNPTAEEDSTFIDYQLIQTGAYSGKLDYGDIWYGDGPTGYSLGALKVGSVNTSDSWIRKGEVTGINHAQLLLREILDLQRVTTRNLRADLYGSYIPDKVLKYDSTNFFFLGGQQTGTQNRWDADFIQINIQTGSDTFQNLPKFEQESVSGTASAGGGGLDTDTADDRYLLESNNLSDLDSASTALGNLGLTATASELNILDGATLSTAELNILDGVTATTAELNQLDGNNFTSGITGTSADFSGALDADTLRPDSGKFLSPVSYQMRNAGDTGFRDVEMAGLTATSVTASNLTAGRLPFVGASGLITDSANATLDSSGNLDVVTGSFNGDVDFVGANRKIQYPRELWLRENAWDSGDYINWRAGQAAGSEAISAVFFDDSLATNTEFFRLSKSGVLSRINSIQIGTTTVIDSSRNFFGVNGTFSGTLGVTGNATFNADVDIAGTATIATAEIDTLRTTLFKPNSISGMGGEFLFNGTSQVVSIDTVNDTIVVEDSVFTNGDAVVVSSQVGTTGFSKTRLNITSTGSAVSGGTQYSYTVDGTSSGADTDIESGYTVVKVDGNVIYVNANEGATNAPFIEGYSSVTDFTLLDGTATPNWYIRNNEISVGSVFSADGNANTGTLAGFDFTATQMSSLSASGGIKLDATGAKLTLFEDNGTTSRLSLDILSNTLTTSATVRDSQSGTNTATGTAIDIVDYERISGAYVVEELTGDPLETYNYRVLLQGYDGSTWVTIDFIDGTLAGQTSSGSFPFTLQDKSGYVQFRLQVQNNGTPTGNFQFDSYNYEQYKSEMIYNERGLNIVGGNFYLTDIPLNDVEEFNIDNLPSNTVYSDEKDASGNWILKLKV